jgi:ATP-dependent exoDNAse (exonuclease V) beta subunit
MVEEKNPDFLYNKNSHQRDKNITFDEGPHIYTINGDSSFTSVTTWNHSHFKQFDSMKIIRTMNRGKNSKYYGMTDQEILNMWEENRDKSAKAGTKMHYDIECFYNNIDNKNDTIEFQYFKNFHNKNNNLIPYRTEWMVYAEDLKLAGSIDMVYENSNGDLLIYDWKRCKDIKEFSYSNELSTTECIGHIYDTNYWHYALQLNTYARILRDYYGKKVIELKLVCLHPDNKNKDYIIYDVPFLNEEIDNLFSLRKNDLKNK